MAQVEAYTSSRPHNIRHWPVGFGLPCASCDTPYSPRDTAVFDFCSGINLFHCAACNGTSDVWSSLLKAVRASIISTDVYAFAGANMCFFNMTLKRGEICSFTREELSIPSAARILHMNFTPVGIEGEDGTLFPLLGHSNSPDKLTSYSAQTFHLYPMPMSDEAKKSGLNVNLIWVRKYEPEEPRALLVDAVHAYSEGRFEDLIVPANVAAELSTARLVAPYINRLVSKQNADGFLEQVTYGHRLNVMVPLIAKACSRPPLHDNVRGQLNRLRGLRNDIAHTGVPAKPIDRTDAANMLSAAILGVEYMKQLAVIANP